MSLQNLLHFIPSHRKMREMKELYLSVAVMTFARNLISLFVPVYLYGLGYQISKIIFFFFLISLYFVLFSYLGAKFTAKAGMKHSILTSVPFLILFFLGLSVLPDYPALFFVLPAFKAARMILYNYGYHMLFLENSTFGHRGTQVSIINIVSMLATVLAPIFSGLIIYYFGFRPVFFLGSLLLMFGTIPLFMTKEKYRKIQFSSMDLVKIIFGKSSFGMVASFSGYAIESVIEKVLWPIFLILILANTRNVGAMVTFAMALSLGIFYFVGKMTDRYNKFNILKTGTFMYAFGWVLRIFANGAGYIVGIDTFKAASSHVLQVPWSSYFYDIAQGKNGFKYMVMRETVFNLSRVLILPFIMLLFYINYYPFILSFIIASIFSLFYVFIIEKKKVYYKKLFNN